MRVKTCIPYLLIVCVVMTIYSAFLVHLSKSVRPPNSYGFPPTGVTSAGGRRPDPWDARVSGTVGATGEEPLLECTCTWESAEGLEKGSHVAMELSTPYRYFNSNHWFHISEYYVSRHTQVARKLPKEATVYIVAPYLFVTNLLPMTFFLMLLAFTDGTTRTAEVLPQDALVGRVSGTKHGDVAWALNTSGVESYVYDSSLPAFKRTRRYKPGERQRHSHEQPGATVVSHSHRALTSVTWGERVHRENAAAIDKIPTDEVSPKQREGRSVSKSQDRPSLRGEVVLNVITDPDQDGPHSHLADWADRGADDVDIDWEWRSRRQGETPPAWDDAMEPAERTIRDSIYADNSKIGASSYDLNARDESRHERTLPIPENRRVNVNVDNHHPLPVIGYAVSRNTNRHPQGSSWSDDCHQEDGGETCGSENLSSTIGPATASSDAHLIVDEQKGATRDERKLLEDRMLAGRGRRETDSLGPDSDGGGVEADAMPRGRGPQPTAAFTTASEDESCECAKYIGEFGAAPVERGYWFKHEPVQDARTRIDVLCGDIYRRRQEGRTVITGLEKEEATSGETIPTGGTREKRLVIYQRDADRRLLDLEGNIKTLQAFLGPQWTIVSIVHNNGHEPCWLYSQLMDADMLLTPHGFQSMLLLFLPPGATILEVFPYKYWKEGYAPLAEEWGVRHQHIMSRPVTFMKGLALFFIPLERCMRSIECRKWSRSADVRLEEHHLKQIAKVAKAASRKKQEFLPPRFPVTSDKDSERR